VVLVNRKLKEETMMIKKGIAEIIIRHIRRATHRKYSEEKIHLALEGFRVENRVTELFRKSGIDHI
jgi:hypothetical protein